MTPFQWAATFGGTCILAACAITAWCCVVAVRQGTFDAEITADKTPDMGDALAVFEVRQDDLRTPIYDRLAAERVIASAGEVIEAEWARSEVYDVDDWPGAS